jgi:hypothetical protein
MARCRVQTVPHDVHLPATAVHKVPRALTVLQQELRSHEFVLRSHASWR